MAQKLYEESNIQAIANAIREKNGATDAYLVSEMAAAIAAIEGGGGEGGGLDFSELSFASLKPTGYVNYVDLSAYISDYSQVKFLMFSNAASSPLIFTYIPDALSDNMIAVYGDNTVGSSYSYGPFHIPGYLQSSSHKYPFNYDYRIEWVDATSFRYAIYDGATRKSAPTEFMSQYNCCAFFYKEA